MRANRWKLPIRAALAAAVAALFLLPAVGEAAERTTPADVERGLERLVRAPGGPPGAIATLHRRGKTIVMHAGQADVERRRKPRRNDHMRIASIAKAFSGAVALRIVEKGELSLDDTIGEWLPDLPSAWAAVTVRQMLHHTSGLPDYTTSDGFFDQVSDDPQGIVRPRTIIDWVRDDDLEFPPNSKYEYSNTDNIVIALIAKQATGDSYRRLLERYAFRPAKLHETSFPARRVTLPNPFIHGYIVDPGEAPEDVTSFLSPSGAWASGAIVSTPRELGAFIRADLGQKLFGAAEQQQQHDWIRGSSSPPGPGANSAGLALFRYKTRCGTVFGHTGNFPGYVQWAAATRNGKRSVTTSLNIPAPSGDLLRRLRAVQTRAVCALLHR